METIKIFFKNVFMLLVFQYRRLFRTWTSWFIFLGPFGLLLMTAFVIPPENLMYLIIGVGVAASTFFQFGSTFREWKQNNLIRANMKFTNYGIMVGFFTFFLFSAVIALSAVLFCLGLSYVIFEAIGLHPISSDFWNFDWGAIFYISFLSIIVSLAVAYFFEAITRTSTSYALLSTFYLLLIIFGAGFMNTLSLGLAENAEENNFIFFQLIIPHWYINRFVLNIFHYGFHQAFSWGNNIYNNLTLFMPYVYSIVLFVIANIINNRKYEFGY